MALSRAAVSRAWPLWLSGSAGAHIAEGLRVETLVSPSWVAWREIEVLGD